MVRELASASDGKSPQICDTRNLNVGVSLDIRYEETWNTKSFNEREVSDRDARAKAGVGDSRAKLCSRDDAIRRDGGTERVGVCGVNDGWEDAVEGVGVWGIADG